MADTNQHVIDSMGSLIQILKEEDILNKHNLPRIGIYGSFARSEKANDIDIYIESDALGYKDIVELRADLEKLTGMKIDIMLKKYANPIILYYAEKDMIYVTN